EDYTSKYKGEQVEVALFGGEYQEGVLTAYCYVDEVAHIELNGHILVPLQNIASLHCSSRCDAPQNEDWPPRGLLDDGQGDGAGNPDYRPPRARRAPEPPQALAARRGVRLRDGANRLGARRLTPAVDLRLRGPPGRTRRMVDVRPRRARDAPRARGS